MEKISLPSVPPLPIPSINQLSFSPIHTYYKHQKITSMFLKNIRMIANKHQVVFKKHRDV